MANISSIPGQSKDQILQTWFSGLRGLYAAACSISLATVNLQMARSYIKKEKTTIAFTYIKIQILGFFLKPFTWGTESLEISSHSNFSLPCFKSWTTPQVNTVFVLPIFPWFVWLCTYLWRCRIYMGLWFWDFYLFPLPARKIPAKITAFTLVLYPFPLHTFYNKREKRKKLR